MASHTVHAKRNYWARRTASAHASVVKTDGKILDYGRRMLVKDIMMNLSSPVRPVTPLGGSSSPSSVDSENVRGIKRIKVIITKQQLEELLSRKLSGEEMLSRVEEVAQDGVGSLTRWRPMLETIPEGSE
ncbi:hypothetical protein L1049_023011 [Liquidambar formosana]|uniref:Uncharacterized protein n=1 Tax=Liquidambar formosana TaxID=63359 RepID=A0AAP0RDC6_LIQFO